MHKLPTDGVAVAQRAAELLQYHVVASTGGGSHMVSLGELESYLDGGISVPGMLHILAFDKPISVTSAMPYYATPWFSTAG